LLYRIPEGVELRPTPQPGGEAIEGGELRLLGLGSQTVLPPSRHKDSGRRYAWASGHGPGEIEPAVAPTWLVELMRADRKGKTGEQANRNAGAGGEKIHFHSRDTTLASLAGSMRRRSMGEPEILAALLVTNRNRCVPPLPESDIAKIAHSIAGYPPGEVPAETDSWADLIPFGDIPAVLPFPVEVFPDDLRDALLEASQAIPCPVDYLAVPLLAAAGSCIGRSRALAVKNKYVQHALLYTAVVAPPGSGKSPALELVTEPLHEQEEKFHEEWELQLAAYEVQMAEYEAELAAYKAAKKKSVARKAEADTETDKEADKKPDAKLPVKPPRPVRKRALTDNATVESLALILRDNARGVLLAKDELIAWVKAMNQYRPAGKGDDEQFWLSNWSCTTFIVDRKGDHDHGPLIAKKPFVGVTGCITPTKLKTLRGDVGPRRADDDGRLDRILLSHPEEPDAEPEDWNEVSPQTAAVLSRTLKALRGLPMEPVKDGEKVKSWRPFLVKLTGDGRAAWQQFTREHCRERNAPDFPGYLVGPWSKLRGYCARIALIIQYLRWASGEDVGGCHCDVDGESVRKAARLITYFKSHARKVYGIIDADEQVAEARRVVRWLREGELSEKSELSERVQGRDIKRSDLHAGVWGGSRSVAQVEPVLELLLKHNYLRAKEGGKGRPRPGRKPSPIFEVHPTVFASFEHPGTLSENSDFSENSPDDRGEGAEREPGEEG
jgi:hypothetical protein